MIKYYIMLGILSIVALGCGSNDSLTSSVQNSADVKAKEGWFDNDHGRIWGMPPGFYKQGSYWVAVVHTHNSVKQMHLVGDFTQWLKSPIEMTRTPDKKFWWLKVKDDAFIRAPKSGDHYKFMFNNDFNQISQDPAARWQENTGSGSSSKLYLSDTYNWKSNSWQRPSWEYYMIYQLHPRRFSKRNKHLSYLQRITEELNNNGKDDYINNLGVTAIQLLPINGFATDTSWGYNPSYWYAIESSYGTPDQLKELVDTAHQNGIAVIMDVVYNHGGNSDNILGRYNFGTYYDGDTVWGPLINYDSDVARHYFVQNLKYLAQEFRIDGFRFDHTKSTYDVHNTHHVTHKGSGGGWHFIREMRQALKSVDSRIIMIAEDLPNNWSITQDNVGISFGGDYHAPFDSQWADNFRDSFYSVLAGGNLDRLKDAFTYFGDSWHDPVVYVESHDEVGNEDNRVAKRARDGRGWEMSQVSATGTFMSRGIPMYFMGHESGEDRQFHIDNWDDSGVLNLSQYESDKGRSKVRNWFQRMAEIRRQDSGRLSHGGIDITHINDTNGVFAFTRDNGKYLIVLNFKGTDWYNYNVGVTGNYVELANTSWDAYKLNPNAPLASRGSSPHFINDVHVPSYGAVILVRWD